MIPCACEANHQWRNDACPYNVVRLYLMMVKCDDELFRDVRARRNSDKQNKPHFNEDGKLKDCGFFRQYSITDLVRGFPIQSSD